MSTPTTIPNPTSPCWFCSRPSTETCKCGRDYCDEHSYDNGCFICALGFGLFERDGRPETVSGLVTLSLSKAAGDPYIVIPAEVRDKTPLPLARAEDLVNTLMMMAHSPDFHVCRRAVAALAATTNSWPSMNPSQLSKNKYGASLLAADQVRRRLLSILRRARSQWAEPIAVAILEKLRTADFRDLYPEVAERLGSFTYNNLGGRVGEVFQALIEFYPAAGYAANEHCELMVYEQYMNRQRGAGEMMERIWGHRLRYEPGLARLLKKGVFHTNPARFADWYPGEDEPY
jgi:hypothetical protein